MNRAITLVADGQKGFVKLQPFWLGGKGEVKFILWFELQSYCMLFLHPKTNEKKQKRSDVLG